MLHGLGIETGIDLERVVETGQWICGALKLALYRAIFALTRALASFIRATASARSARNGMPPRTTTSPFTITVSTSQPSPLYTRYLIGSS